MRRIAGLSMTLGLMAFGLGSALAVVLPVASLSPSSGAAGSEITVNVSQYSPNIVIEVHEGDSRNGALIGTGMTGAGGTGSFTITVPSDWAVGSHLVYICGLCTAQYPEWATRNFSVTSSPGTTTTSTIDAPPTTAEAPTTSVGDPPTTSAATATSAAPTSTTIASSSTALASPSTSAEGAGSSSRGVLIGVLVALLAAVLGFEGYLIGRLNARRRMPPPPPPPPAV